jgi:thiosulfate reductase cytochrome b subunit
MTHNEKRTHWVKEGGIGLATGILFGLTNVVVGHVTKIIPLNPDLNIITKFVFLAVRYDQNQNASSERIREFRHVQIVLDCV